jgi:hypothetical protein
MRIDFLYDPDCPSREESFQRLIETLAEAGIDAEIVSLAITTVKEAETFEFLGSPTIRIDGLDIDANTRERRDYSLSCRAYRRSDGRISPLPPKELIATALRRSAH